MIKKIDQSKLYKTLRGSIIAIHKINLSDSGRPNTIDYWMLDYPESMMNTVTSLALEYWSEIDEWEKN